jgi:ferredoxin--NADP+ reductase
MPDIRVAIVGAGPAGFYAADRLLKAGVQVELLDRLATPWGLVRAGVAPDHPKIKSVTRVYEKTAALEGFRFHGHVEVGADVSHEELLAHHHAVIYSYGASRDRRLGIPGEDLPGSHAATDFVAWYNGHPDACDHEFDLSGKRAVVVGNGNVALDVARMLLLSREQLAVTDVADHALGALAASSIEEVVVLGRRGPVQAAYTTPELRELEELLTDTDVIVDPAEAAVEAPEDADGTVRRNVEIVQRYAATAPQGRAKRLRLRYLVSPTAIAGDGRVEAIELVRNRLVDNRAVATEETEQLECGLVLRSVGYAGAPIDGVPFDDGRATIANEGGRVAPGVYAAGWIKRGPSGVIGTNKKCAYETVDALLADVEAGALPAPGGDAEAFDALLAERCPERVDYAGWARIDAHERAAGEMSHPPRPRVKVTRRDELVAHGARSTV